MSATVETFTLARADLHLLNPGDRITAIDGRPFSWYPLTVAARPDARGAVPLVNRLGTDSEWWLYPDTQVMDSVTVERGEPDATEPAPAAEPPVLVTAAAVTARDIQALRRNPQYVQVLRHLYRPDGTPGDTRGGRYSGSGWAVTAGMIVTYYGWLEKAGPHRYRVTAHGEAVLRWAEAR